MRVNGPFSPRVAMLPTTLQMSDAARPFLLGFAQGRQGVRRLAGLRNDDGQRVLRNDRVAVAVLETVVDVDRPRQRLDQNLPTRAACQTSRTPERPDALDRLSTSSGISISCRNTLPPSSDARPRTV